MKYHLLVFAFLCAAPGASYGDDLFNGSAFPAVAGDHRAQHVGDLLTVVVYQSAEARNAAQNTGRKARTFDGSVSGGDLNESGHVTLNGDYTGQGEVRSSETFVTQISVVVEDVLPNGDLVVGGQQQMAVSGETTIVRIHGRVRPVDISPDNQVLSTRIAEAQISYNGRGFVSRNARPGLVHRLFSLLGLGG